MAKEEALSEFLKGLRIALNTSSAYSKDHPYFIKFAKEFKQKVDALFVFLNPIKINVTPNSLFLDGKCWEKPALYVELAQIFHFRKIKMVELRQGLTLEEVVDFLSSIALAPKEIVKQGGMEKILNQEKYPHIYITELDYSQLLKDEGEQSKDIWSYLFMDMVVKADLTKIRDFADNFGKIIRKFKVKNLFEDEELRQNIYNFLEYLKPKDKNRFTSCTKALLSLILRDAGVSREEKLEKLKLFFKELNNDDFLEVLWNEISTAEDVGSLSFKVFSRLIDEDRHKALAPALEDKIRGAVAFKTNPRIRKKVKELFSGGDEQSIPAFYRHALYSLFDNGDLKEQYSFDRALARNNYQFLLLNLADREKDREKIILIAERLLAECEYIIKARNLEYLKLLLGILDKRQKEDPALRGIFEGLIRRLDSFIEHMAFESEPAEGLAYFIDNLKSSSLGYNFYLEKIFNDARLNSYVLKLFLKFFPEQMPLFYENLEQKSADIEFSSKMIKGLEAIDSLWSVEILKRIFSFSNNIIKIEALKAMQGLSHRDVEFLLPILENEEALLKRQALLVLTKEEGALKTGLEKLFLIPSFFGRKNKLIIENIAIVKDIELRAAQDYLATLSKRRFFWNRNLRKKAREALEGWDVRKD